MWAGISNLHKADVDVDVGDGDNNNDDARYWPGNATGVSRSRRVLNRNYINCPVQLFQHAHCLGIVVCKVH